MPINFGRDEKGCFVRWGSGQKQYFNCNDPRAKQQARKKIDSIIQNSSAIGLKVVGEKLENAAKRKASGKVKTVLGKLKNILASNTGKRNK